MGKLRHSTRSPATQGKGTEGWSLGDTIGVLLGDGGEDAEASTKLFDGATRLEPTVPLLLLGLQEIIAEMFPLLGREHAQDPGREVAWVPEPGASTHGCFGAHCAWCTGGPCTQLLLFPT